MNLNDAVNTFKEQTPLVLGAILVFTLLGFILGGFPLSGFVVHELTSDAQTVLLFHLDETQGNTVSNAVNGQSFRLARPKWVKGLVGTSALHFSGANARTSSYAYLENQDMNGSFTLEAVVQLDKQTRNKVILDNKYNYRMSISGNQLLCGVYDQSRKNGQGSFVTVKSSTRLATNKVYTVACVYDHDAGTFTTFINNKKDRVKNVRVRSWKKGQTLYLGMGYGGKTQFQGTIDEVRVSNVARNIMPPATGQETVTLPDGATYDAETGKIILPEGTMHDVEEHSSSGEVVLPDGATYDAETGKIILPDSAIYGEDSGSGDISSEEKHKEVYTLDFATKLNIALSQFKKDDAKRVDVLLKGLVLHTLKTPQDVTAFMNSLITVNPSEKENVCNTFTPLGFTSPQCSADSSGELQATLPERVTYDFEEGDVSVQVSEGIN